MEKLNVNTSQEQIYNLELIRLFSEGGEYFQKCRSAMQEKVKELQILNT